MREDDASDPERSGPDVANSASHLSTGDNQLGVFSVLSPGVHIMLDGRPVTMRGH